MTSITDKTISINLPSVDAIALINLIKENPYITRMSPTTRYLIHVTDSGEKDYPFSVHVERVVVTDLTTSKVLEQVIKTVDAGGHCYVVIPEIDGSLQQIYPFWRVFVPAVKGLDSSGLINTRLIVWLICTLKNQEY